MVGGSQPSTTTQISKVELPKWVEAASEENYNYAKDIAGRPLVQYQGPRVADQSGLTTGAYNLLAQNVGASDPIYEDAYGMLAKAGSDFDAKPYFNPFIENVESRAISNAERALTGQLNQVGSNQRNAGAFGGSRAAIESGIARAEGARGIGDLSAGLRKAGWDTATTTALQDRAGMRDTASGLMNLGTSRQASMMQDVMSMLGLGSQEQAYRQSQIDADMGKFYEKRDYPLEQLNTRLAALGMSPYGKTETSTKTGTSEKQGTDWATVGLGFLKTLPALFAMSDRTVKTDIKRVGKKKGVPVYSYRYKGDPKTYPKMVGPMAQDIEKVKPEAVHTVAGKKVVDIGTMMEFLDA